MAQLSTTRTTSNGRIRLTRKRMCMANKSCSNLPIRMQTPSPRASTTKRCSSGRYSLAITMTNTGPPPKPSMKSSRHRATRERTSDRLLYTSTMWSQSKIRQALSRHLPSLNPLTRDQTRTATIELIQRLSRVPLKTDALLGQRRACSPAPRLSSINQSHSRSLDERALSLLNQWTTLLGSARSHELSQP